MTKIDNNSNFTMNAPNIEFSVEPKQERVLFIKESFKSNRSVSRRMIKCSPATFLFFQEVTYLLVTKADIDKCLTVDLTKLKKRTSATTYHNHISKLVSWNVIIKIGSKSEFLYIVNPCAAHCLSNTNVKIYKLERADTFPKITIK